MWEKSKKILSEGNQDLTYEDCQRWFRNTWMVTFASALLIRYWGVTDFIGIPLLVLSIIFTCLDLLVAQVSIDRRDALPEEEDDEDS